MGNIGVSRRSILNWRDKPESIKPDFRMNIDVLYCKHFLIPEWDHSGQSFSPVLLPDDMTHQKVFWMPLLRQLSFGTFEIEGKMSEKDFESAVHGRKLPRNMDRKAFLAAWNTFSTLQFLWMKIVQHGERFLISDESIRRLHADFLRGVHEDAGFFSKHVRIMGKLDHFQTTLPEDIPEEINRWVFKCASASSMEDIAMAHAYFIAIHPFGDGNGRVGRALVMIQCLNAGLMPPILNHKNQAMYYAAVEHAMEHGRNTPLIRLFHDAAEYARHW